MKTTFNKTKLATSLSLVLGASALSTGYATAAEEKEVEVIQVTGIRGALMRSMDLKRESVGVVDAISAEDMGKFPDTNLAESLQRISGVSIDRSNGEGSKVTVRGFGPHYNLVTLNNRQMPTAELEATKASDSRSFDFGNLASEGISAVEVYKTGRASIATGGIGSTINLSTLRPLNSPGMKASVGVKAVHDMSSETGSSFTPEISGLYSNTFAGDKIGVALVGSYQNRQSGSARAGVDNGWRPFNATDGGWGTLPAAPTDGSIDPHLNRPTGSAIYAVPQNLVYGFKEVDRTRTNGQLTLQYRPIDDLTATLDYTYSKNEVETQQNLHSVWMNFGHSSSEWSGPVGGVFSPIKIKENNTNVSGDEPPFGHETGDLNYSDLVSQVEQSGQVNENKSLGINLEYQVSDNLKLTLDMHSSSAEAKPNTIYGNSNTIQMATNIRGATEIDFNSEFPVATITFPNAYNISDFDGATANPLSGVSNLTPERVRTTGTSFRNSYMRSDIDQIQFNGTYSFDDGIVESIDFGIGHNTVNNRNAFGMAERATWGGVGQYDDVPNDLLLASQSSMADRFDNLPGDKSKMINSFWSVNFTDIANIVGSKYGVPLNADGSEADAAWPCGTQICAPSKYTTDRRTEEVSLSAFTQAKIVFDIGSIPTTIYTGLRYEKTDVTSNTLLPAVERIGWIADNEFTIQRGDSVFSEGTGSYNYVLPNIDIQAEVIDDLLVKASYSKTIGRAPYGFLTAGVRLDEVRFDQAKASSGNPGLLPIESSNIDLSVEWYYDEGSYVSIGYFDKSVDAFIAPSSQYLEGAASPFNVNSPLEGARFDNAVAVVGADSPADIRNQIIQTSGADGVHIEAANADTGEAAKIWGHPSENDNVNVTLTSPVNQDNKSLNGFEMAIQHIFADTGFGFIANATFVDSDLTYDNGTLGNQEAPLIGLSDSYNLVGFYDKDGLQIRLAYNWRDDFLNATVDAIGDAPVYTQAYGQLDANVSYEVSEHLSLFVEAINLTDEYTRDYGRHQLMTYNIEQTGTRVNVGARYKF
nr:TonB-dependent receptor [Algibacillus agarilyticus]